MKSILAVHQMAMQQGSIALFLMEELDRPKSQDCEGIPALTIVWPKSASSISISRDASALRLFLGRQIAETDVFQFHVFR